MTSATCCCCCPVISQSEVGIIEHFGKFERSAPPGLHCICFPFTQVRGVVNLRVDQIIVKCESKTSDDVTCNIDCCVQYQVPPDKVIDAFYKLENPRGQITSYVLNAVRSILPTMTLDEVYREKDVVAKSVRDQLEKSFNDFGYNIVATLITDINPDKKVVNAMNEINANRRLRIAATDKAEADKILMVKKAEGEAESKHLSGKGIAMQRKAIVDGLRCSVTEFQNSVPGTTPRDVMELVMMTQFFDTLKDISADSSAKTIFVPYTPSAVRGFADEIRTGIMQGGEVGAPEQLTMGNPARLPPKA